MNIKKRNHVVVKGNDSNPIIFGNGFGCDQTIWKDVTPAFEKEHQIILFDHVGTGRSNTRGFREEKYNVLDGYVEDIISICELVEVENTIFVGHSVAAMMGIIAAERSPCYFKKLVLLCPSPRHLNDTHYKGGFTPIEIEQLLDFMDDDFEGWSHWLSKAVMGNSNRPTLEQKFLDSLSRISSKVVNSFAQATFLSDNRPYLKRVNHPTLIIQTNDDLLVPSLSTQYTHRNIPNSELIILEEKGHCPHLSAPELVINEIRKFI